MKNSKKRNIAIVCLLIAVLMSGAIFGSFAATQKEKDAATNAAKKAQQATEARREEARRTAKEAAAAVENFEEAERVLVQLASEIESTKTEIENKKAEMEAKEVEIEEQNEALNNRLVAMYKTGNSGFIDVILNSESVEDLLTNMSMVQKILESDQKLLKGLQNDYQKLKEMKQSLQDQQIALESKEAETEELKKKYQAEADRLHALQKQKEAEAAAMAAEAAAMQAQAEAMIVESGGNVNSSPGGYLWPTKSNWQISGSAGRYGWRMCPFHGREFHNGVDIVLTSGTYGSPVYAIADGYVTRASYYGGYGNCVQYAIGNNYSVLYGHLSGFNCSAGQYVAKGTVLGYIGSTGDSTGPHLHFTVFRNGSTINPLSLY